MSGAEQIVTLRERTFHGEKGTIMQKNTIITIHMSTDKNYY